MKKPKYQPHQKYMLMEGISLNTIPSWTVPDDEEELEQNTENNKTLIPRKTFKVLPGSYVYPCVYIKKNDKFGVDSRPVKTKDEPWYFDDTEYKNVPHTTIFGLTENGTGATGDYFLVRIPRPVERVLHTNIMDDGNSLKRFKVYGFYVHRSRIGYVSYLLTTKRKCDILDKTHKETV